MIIDILGSWDMIAKYAMKTNILIKLVRIISFSTIIGIKIFNSRANYFCQSSLWVIVKIVNIIKLSEDDESISNEGLVKIRFSLLFVFYQTLIIRWLLSKFCC